MALSTSIFAQGHKPDANPPLRDAAVCAGPDGNYYLTGTIATALPDGTKPSFDYCRGVQVWKSKDLKSWEDLGLVWDLWKDPAKLVIGRGGAAWQTELLPIPGLPAGERAKGMTTPRLLHDGDRFWITFSMNGYAAGAMPGGAEVKGSYQDTRLIVEAGGAPTAKSDATIFVDKDGARYLVWGGGCIARLKSLEDLLKLSFGDVGVDSPVRFLRPADADELPDRGAPYGVQVFHDGRQYQFVFTATTLRSGGIHEDSYVCAADQLFGPYTKPWLLVPDSGRVTAFKGHDGQWRLSYADTRDQLRISEFKATGTTPVANPPKLGPVKIATTVPQRAVSQKPADIPQLVKLIEPCLDRPLRDAAICRGPDGTWYMTGTEAAANADGTLDWSRNNGVHLWSSPDRKNWKDCGVVWEIPEQEPAHLDLTCGAAPRIGRAVTAPEIHFLKGTFWIVYSLNGSRIKLLKSTTGKAEGSYVDVGLNVRGRDPSLFEEAGKVYLVWGEGFYAELNEGMTGLAGPVKTLFTNVAWYPREMRRPEMIGQWGSRLVKQGDSYVWTFTTRTGRGGINAIDSLASWSQSLDGPWGEPCIVLLNGGQSTLVPDGAGGWLATVSGEDEYSQCPFQPALTPVISGGGQKQLDLKPYQKGTSVSQWGAAHSQEATELDLWIGFPDLLGTEIRDVFVTLIDGTYYACGTPWGDNGKYFRQVVLFQSKDLMHWSRLENLYSVEQLRTDGMIQDTAKFDELLSLQQTSKAQKTTIKMGETKFYKFGDRYYINWMCCGGPGIGGYLLQSAGNDPLGPYKAVCSLPSPSDLYSTEEGALLLVTAMLYTPEFKSVEELIEKRTKSATVDKSHMITFGAIPNTFFNEDCEMGLEKVNGKYVFWSTDWTGGYDCNYMVGNSWKEPFGGKLRVIPHGGNGYLFKDKEGGWWYANFVLNTNEWTTRSKKTCRLNLVPLEVREQGGELVLEPKAVVANRARLETMGALWHGQPQTERNRK